MTRLALPVLAASLFGLAACGSEPAPEPAAEPTAAPKPASAATAGQPGEAIGVSSIYTGLNLDTCELLYARPEEAGSAEWRCKGLGDLPLFVAEGDGRFDVDAGIEADRFETLSAFNMLGEKVEWRLKQGKPVAVIFRYLDATDEANGRTVLAVEKIGTAALPGCRVAHVAGNVPDANRVAREIADVSAATFVCGANEMKVVGEAL